MKDERTLDELSNEEYEEYQDNPDKYQEVTNNTIDNMIDMMFPNGRDDDQYRFDIQLLIFKSCARHVYRD